MSIDFSACKEETIDGDVYVTAIADSPELNVANANARLIVEWLGGVFDWCGILDPVKVRDRVRSGIPASRGIETIQNPGSATMIDMGVPEQQFVRYMIALDDIATFAIDNSANIHWS